MTISPEPTIDKYLAPDLPEEQRQAFVVDSDEKAAWAMRKLQQAERRIAANTAIADRDRQAIDEWLADASRSHEHDVEFFTNLLGGWWKQQLSEQLDAVNGDWTKVREKSRSFPGGAIEARLTPPVPTYDAPDQTVEWLEANGLGDYVEVKKQPRKNDLKGAIKAGVLGVIGERIAHTGSGELVPGVHMPTVDDPLEVVSISVKAAQS